MGPPGHFHPSQPAGRPTLIPERAVYTKPQFPLTHPQHCPSRDELTPPGAPSTTGGSKALPPFKLLTIIRLPLLDHVDTVIGEDERDPLTGDSKRGLEIPQNVAEINVDQLRGGESKDGKGVRTEGAWPKGAGRAWRGFCRQLCAEHRGQGLGPANRHPPARSLGS